MLIPEECFKWIKYHRPESKYAEEVEQDFRMIEPYLPEKVASILDIGCGMAGIDVWLKRKYPEASLSLLDGDGETVVYGYGQTSKPYNSRKATEALLAANGVRVDRWHDVDTTEELKADLVISLLSWGFHYPLSTYKVSGYCIADIRKLTPRPAHGTVIHATQKYVRLAFRC